MTQGRVLARTRGVSLTGYGLIVGLISVIALVATTSVGSQVDTLFGTVGDELSSTVTQNGASGGSGGATQPTPTETPIDMTGRASCQALLTEFPAATSGEYQIDPDGDTVDTTVWCDMDSAGGGWTRILYSANANSDGYQNWVETYSTDDTKDSVANDDRTNDDFTFIGHGAVGQGLSYSVLLPSLSASQVMIACVNGHGATPTDVLMDSTPLLLNYLRGQTNNNGSNNDGLGIADVFGTLNDANLGRRAEETVHVPELKAWMILDATEADNGTGGPRYGYFHGYYATATNFAGTGRASCGNDGSDPTLRPISTSNALVVQLR